MKPCLIRLCLPSLCSGLDGYEPMTGKITRGRDVQCHDDEKVDQNTICGITCEERRGTCFLLKTEES